ncbi:MAG TPA: NUDIX domain-containing protein [Bacteroidales bacterium]|nr:NUDIX domain-containing protein [Bacteroidales bacterium]
MEKNPFVIRVYALILNRQNEILLSDEFRMGMRMTKFPGGGLEYGEGTLECLHREALEEFGQDIEITEHFYTTDFFQEAFFYPQHQLISIYYKARFPEPPRFRISTIPFDFEEETEGNQSFRWMRIEDLDPAMITLPVDKRVTELLRQKCR